MGGSTEMIEIGSTKDKNIYMIDNGSEYINNSVISKSKIVYNYKLQLFGLPMEIQEKIMEQVHKWIFQSHVLKIQRPIPIFNSVKLVQTQHGTLTQYNYGFKNDNFEEFNQWEVVSMTKENPIGLQGIKKIKSNKCQCIKGDGEICYNSTNDNYGIKVNGIDLIENISQNIFMTRNFRSPRKQQVIGICGTHKNKTQNQVISDMGYYIRNNCLCKKSGNNGKTWKIHRDFNTYSDQ